MSCLMQVLSAFVSQLCAPPRPVAASRGALQLVPTDFFEVKTLPAKGHCSESVQLVRCPKVGERGSSVE